MDLLRVEAALLRAQLPELVLRPGMTLPARVMERHGQMGLLLLAGTPLSAQLPDELRAGDRLRLRVEDVGEQVVLRTVDTPAAQQQSQTPPPEVALPLPNGGRAELRVTEKANEGAGAGEPVTVALDYDSPALGTLDMRLVQQPGGAGLQVTVGAAAGAIEERVRGAAEDLRAALADATGLPATVRVVGRTPKPRVNLYA
jgi:hypothetical protein